MKKFAPVLLVFFFSNAFSQSSLLKYGQAVMTSGNYLPDNWSFMVYDIRNNGTAVPGMNWMASIYHPSGAATDWKFSRTGPLFGITIDNSGNIFLASCKLLGAPYPPGTAGPGGVYKVDAFSWAVTDFITSDPVYVYNPSTNKIPNHADGLGDICYDKYNDQLFLTNFEDGKIYRISTSGTILSVFDPFSPDLGIVAVADYGERCWAVNVYKDSLSN
ncbi:MAG TPA: hypothetical protein VD905_18310, partial [Flavobacteriales bacterium]|nr:hypothetical protein [Flavobacteriales bacterium]